ncbi:MAG: beta-hydroxyacyl-ACP dehydratase [Chlorobiaceae bacterium]|nr:beta-hydroxyacyl-ACP dehydratase [Chlorobiaceae bacterium]
MEPGKRAVGIRCFSRSELFFMDHFPAYPIVPGVLQIEMIAQLGGKCIVAAQNGVSPVLTAVNNAKFRKEIFPGDTAIIQIDVSMRKSYSTAKGWVEVEGTHVSSAELMFGHITKSEEKRRKDEYAKSFSADITTLYGI